jgi:pectin methylesterase-like acyl-CoA thioesterase
MIKQGKKAFTIIILLLFIPIISVVTEAESNIIYVTVDQNIQSIIDNIHENQIIYLKPGTYNQTITINKKISITGENPNNTIIKAKTLNNKAAIINQNIKYNYTK